MRAQPRWLALQAGHSAAFFKRRQVFWEAQIMWVIRSPAVRPAMRALVGCASRRINVPIAQFDPSAGYRPCLPILLKWILCASLCASQVLGSAARAADSSEFWPELSAYIGLRPDARVYLDASYARGKEADARSLDLSAFIDISIKPVMREQLWSEDWQRSRFFWTRIGYTRVVKATDSTPSVAENRGVISLYGNAPLPLEIWLEARARADLRWIDDDYSARYRFRLEVSREFTLDDRAVKPYFNIEWFYDTRDESWARTLCQAGAEITVSERFRYEIYLARQMDRRPSAEILNAFGLVAKWYF